TDLVCPRQDVCTEIGNGAYLPLFGGDTTPHTRFHQWNEDGDLLPVDDADLAAFLRTAIEERSPASRVPHTEPGPSSADDVPEDHPCAWIMDELEEQGIRLDAAIFPPDGRTARGTIPGRINFACPLHDAKKKRRRGGS